MQDRDKEVWVMIERAAGVSLQAARGTPRDRRAMSSGFQPRIKYPSCWCVYV